MKSKRKGMTKTEPNKYQGKEGHGSGIYGKTRCSNETRRGEVRSRTRVRRKAREEDCQKRNQTGTREKRGIKLVYMERDAERKQ